MHRSNDGVETGTAPQPKCRFCGVDTAQPCELHNCMECQNFGYYPNGKPDAYGVLGTSNDQQEGRKP